MSYIPALDVSHYQGNINWPAVRAAGYQITVVKISGGDDGNYYDSKASQNYYGAKAAGLAVGGYHFAGGTDPIAEAEFFVNGMKPFTENDVFVLDWEVQNADPVGWCEQFVQHVHDLCGVWVIMYMNGSTRNAYNWTRGVIANCGFWIAWYGRDPNSDLPVAGTYIMHQYTSSGSVPGIAGNVDLDAVYMSLAQWNLYGWHAPVTPPTPPAPVITTQEVTTTKPVPFDNTTVNDDTQLVGYSEITTVGVDGVETIVTTITLTDGVQTDSQVTSDTVTTQPVTQVTTVGTKQPDPIPPTPTPNPNVPKKLIAAIIAAVAALVAWFLAWLHS